MRADYETGTQHGDCLISSAMSQKQPALKYQGGSSSMDSMIPQRTDRTTSSSRNVSKQSSHRNSTLSTNSSRRISGSSVDNSTRSAIPRPSAIPRYTPSGTSAKPLALVTSLPTLSTSTMPRKSPMVDHKPNFANRQSPRTMHTAQIKQALKRREDGVVYNSTAGATANRDGEGEAGHRSTRSQSHVTTATTTTNLPPRLIPELQALAYTTQPPNRAPSSLSTISSPSSQFTGSHSPWSASTNTTTSTSWSSTSPSILQTSRSPVNSKRSYTVPIPAIGRSHMPSLPALQETASRCNFSSRSNLRQEAVTPPKKLRKSPAPTPPPRSSSVKSSRSRSNSKDGDKPFRMLGGSPPPLPTRSNQRPTISADGETADFEAQSPAKIAAYHNDLQDALYGIGRKHLTTHDQQHSHDLDNDQHMLLSTRTNPRALWDSAPIKPHSLKDTESSIAQPARSRLAKFSRLTLFTRSPKEATTPDESKSQPRKLQRKGPAAGTGHEGYGKYGRKTKKTSGELSGGGTDSEASTKSIKVKSSPSTARKASSSSSRRDRNSQSDLDDFAATRMKPVVILGGSQQANDLFTSSSGMFELPMHVPNRGESPSIHDGYMQYMHSPEESLRHFPAPVAVPVSKNDSASISQPSSLPGNLETYRLSENIRPTTSSSSRPYQASWNVSQSSVAPSYVTSIDAGSDLGRPETHTAAKQKKRIRRSKWNIFRKRDTSVESDIAALDSQQFKRAEELAVTVSQVPVARPFPYYAMLEPENEPSIIDDFDDTFNDATQMGEADDEDGFGTPDLSHDPNTRERIESILLPSAPQFKRELSRSRRNQRPALRILDPSEDVPKSPQLDQEHRQPRLAQVGRIPKVVSTSPVKVLNRKSFSRPFNQNDQASIRELFQQDVPKTQSKEVLESSELLPSTSYTDPSQGNDFAKIDLGRPAFQQEPQILLEPSKWYDRQSVTSSSSDGMISVMGPSLIPVQKSMTWSKRTTVGEEDVWNEYDDFLDRVTTDNQWRKSPANTLNSDRMTSGEWQAAGKSRIKQSAPSLIALAKGLAIDTSTSEVPILLASPEVLEDSRANDEFRLRRSRIVSALHTSLDPASPFSIGDYLLEHADRRRNSDRQSSHLSSASEGMMSSPKSLAPTSALPAVPETQHYGRTLRINDVQRIQDPAKHAELSYASLMVSRWLSFGQVLFSPAHNELQRQPQKQVLVIDGLGNDDWSIYCAVTYQTEHAYIYDFKETGHTHRGDIRKTDSVPANFRRREIASFHGTFNFPDNFFSVVVFRFPPMMAESKLKHIVSECRRILAPGGHLELMLLDLDIVNMGVVTRRAMRDLKTKMTLSNPDISLRPLIDNVQNVLGDKGFSKLSRCVVGVPVVGTPANSADSPVSSRSSGDSEQTGFSPSAGPRPFDNITANNQQGFSLHDLVADHSDGADAKISKLVSRTARNWWQRCFEATVISDGNLTRSILANKQVLSECKSRASNFKLLIAHAQKPLTPAIEAKRRTMSEPFIATLAPT